MIRMKHAAVGASVVVLALASMPAFAGTINTLFSSGVITQGNPLAEGSGDTHYSLVTQPVGSNYPTTPVVTITDGFPIPPWIANDSSSQWIQPASPDLDDPNAGNYQYQTTFDLTGFNPGTANVQFQVAVDNTLTDVLLNGNSTGITYNQFNAFSQTFTLTSGFSTGINTLTFNVNNIPGGHPNPSALRVNILSATANANVAAPEPGSLPLALGGIAFTPIVAKLRRRRKA